MDALNIWPCVILYITIQSRKGAKGLSPRGGSGNDSTYSRKIAGT